ncbi:WD repeat domain-containing protein [Colletotrichum truncatum]|uniref:WD repeat domain-containing protein n=1 Tax=Colletotrichum truncatum TaxID=5467 RepID=A0ACC3YTX0_COLTU|nr:WD repeat domain-containing protein [Colletotrichum truncatum]KAF6798563.1 WD repeat domain-containing protein [Colletotrichum truncatum]
MNRHAKPGVAGPSLRRDHKLTPVTGLCFFTSTRGGGDGQQQQRCETYLLVGEDTDLKVYDGDGRLLCQMKVFHAQPIHGVSVGGGEDGQQHVLLWGNQAVTVLPLSLIEARLSASGDDNGELLPEIVEAKAPDWIYDGAISPEEPGRGVLVTAHNEVLEFSFSEDGKTLEFGRIVSPSRPILYSANLAWTSKTSVLVAGGTAFGEILLWKCHFSDENKPWCEVLFVFTGHEGSIFGVDISPEIDLGAGGTKARLLASCSDDRTIRIWDISERPDAPRLQYDSFGEARETGFGGAIADAAAAAAAADLTTTQVAYSAPLAMVMGHISRIWHVRFPRTLNELASGRPARVFSFGEDSTLQTWTLEVDVQQWQRKCLTAAAAAEDDVQVTAKIMHQETYARHDGKHIWATALTQLDNGEVLVATGGQDSKVNLFSDRSRAATGCHIEGLPSELRTLVTRDIVGKLPALNPEFAVPTQTKEAFHRFAFIDEDTLLATTTTGRLMVGSWGAELMWSEIGTNEETLAAFRACTSLKSPGRGLALLGTANKKIFLYRNSTVQEIGTVPGKVADIFCLDSLVEDSGRSKLDFLVTILGGEASMQILTLDLETYTILSMVPTDLDNRFIVTAACVVGDLLVLGSRHGYMSAFRRSGDQLTAIPAPDRRTTDSITSIGPLSTSSSVDHIIVTSRDGNYRIYEITPSALLLHHETAPTAVPNIEEAWLMGTDLILCGFRSKNFVIWNETQHEELVRVNCGGAHRAFAYSRRDHVRFVFNKAATLGVYEQPDNSAAIAHHRTLKRGTHGREVRAVAYSGRYVATGAEDTAIRIWEYKPAANPLERELQCVKIVKVHTAGLQSLKWLGEEYLFSCSGNEEFMVWRVKDLGVPGLGLMREAVFTDRSAEGDLRITSFDVAWLKEAVAITMAFSNSVVKTYRYTPEGGFELLVKGQYTGACLVQVRHLRISPEGVLDIVTAATDGHLAVWRSSCDEYVLKYTTRIHQSSIKALDVHANSERFVVLTGGDDNALGVTTLDPNADFAPVARAGVRKAHAAAINGLTFLKETNGGGMVYATASNDQRVKMWKLCWRGGVEEITLLADEYSGVADAGDLEVIGDGKMVVGGVGLEVWDWASSV